MLEYCRKATKDEKTKIASLFYRGGAVYAPSNFVVFKAPKDGSFDCSYWLLERGKKIGSLQILLVFPIWEEGETDLPNVYHYEGALEELKLGFDREDLKDPEPMLNGTVLPDYEGV